MMRFLLFFIVCFVATAPAVKPYDFWADKRVADSFVSQLNQRGYSSMDTWNLIWVLHEGRIDAATAAAYLLAQPGTDKGLAKKELYLELVRWRDSALARYVGGALATLASCEWTETALPRLEEASPVVQIGIAQEMARCKDYRGWPWVKRHLASKTTSDVLFGEAMAASYPFEMMDTGKGRRFSMAAELAELLDSVAPERRVQVQRSLDKVQGDTWRGKPNYDRLPTLPGKK
ncbi:MAG: hypothetical protein U5J83_07270 [Bryobacterales bacterium]|nr:hypothetical protein [Bryobacterales bacterium]